MASFPKFKFRDFFGRNFKQYANLIFQRLLQPFWPTGSGCARGFLGVLDTCYAMQEWCEGHKSVLQILAERESIFRLLPQTTSENLIKDHKNYNPDPDPAFKKVAIRIQFSKKSKSGL